MNEITLKFLMIVIITCFLLAVIPVSAVKTAEQSVGDTLTRGSRFAVTITGLPNSSYYIWLPHTSSMTGEPHDQPPVIADYQTNVMQDPADGPWTIGSYQYNNGGGQTIRDDIAPSTPDMPNTQYYALVTTNSAGQATVEFHTSINTGLRSYSVKVENPRSVDSDNLLVELQVYSRKAPVIIEVSTTTEPSIQTPPPTTAPTQLPETPTIVTTIPVSLPTTMPAPATTTKAAQDTVTVIIAAGAVILMAGRH
jgi:hypothetical protein